MDQPTQVAGQDQTKNHTTDNDENPGWTDSHKRQKEHSSQRNPSK